MPRARMLAVAAAMLLGATAQAGTPENAERLAERSLTECERGRKSADRDVRAASFAHGQALAERAVALDDNLASGHFALFCNLGELMRIDGESIRSVLALRRLMHELDRTLALEPHHADALASKGTLLVRLPRLLGGDAEKGEAMLRQVIAIDPMAVTTRITLAKRCGARGDRDEAIEFASRALQIARQQGRADKVAEAQATLEELGAAE